MPTLEDLKDDDKFCDCFGFPRLFPWQREVAACAAERVIGEKGRQAGWSTLLNVLSLMIAVRNANHTIVRVSASDRQVSADAEELLRHVPRHILSKNAVDRIVFKNGSSLHCVPPVPNTIRGFRPRFSRGRLSGITLMIDEAAHIDQGERVLRALEYALLAAPEGARRIYIGSTPTTASSWFHQLYLEGKNNPSARIASFHFTSMDNPNVRPEDVEYLRQTKPGFEFANEVLGQVLTSETCYFSDVLDRSIAKYTLGMIEEGVRVLGIDLAKIHGSRGKDRHALCEWTRTESKIRLTWLRVFRQSSVEEIAALICQRGAETGGFSKVQLEAFDSSGLFELLIRAGQPVELVTPTPQKKMEAFSYWHALMATVNCEISEEAVELIEEMQSFEYRVSQTGQVSFGHPEGSTRIHDDLVHASAWALFALKGLGYPVAGDTVFVGPPNESSRLQEALEKSYTHRGKSHVFYDGNVPGGLSAAELTAHARSWRRSREDDPLRDEMRARGLL